MQITCIALCDVKENKLQIHGLNKLTLLDYPEHTACTLFTGHCNFRCPFCQNSSLVLAPEAEPIIEEAEIDGFLKKRRGLIEGVCITGGEPTIDKELKPFIRKVKSAGYLVKLDTNGYNPDILEELLEENLLDMVAMDIKSSRESYAKAAGIPTLDIRRIERSVDLLRNSKITYEFRTTMVKGLQTMQDMASIGHWLAGVPRYYLQNYEESSLVLDKTCQPFTPEALKTMLEIVQKQIPQAKLRGL